MIIYPAIDLRKGKCVRLYQGDFERETIYSTDPNAIAQQFAAAGSSWLHLIDLDGAKNPDSNQHSLICELLKTSQLKVQTGGGIRTKKQIAHLLDQGAARVIIGSVAVTQPKTVSEWFNYFGTERLGLALDVLFNDEQKPMVTLNAWAQTSEYSLFELIDYYQAAGLKHLLCTNIHLDGTLNGPDYTLYDLVLKQYPLLQLQASGGIQSISDVTTLQEKGLSGAIIGRALYENKFTLPEVLSC